MSSEFFAALAGAIVGGLISLVLQHLNYRREDRLRTRSREIKREADREENAEREAVAAFLLLAKVSRAHTDISNFRKHLSEAVDRAGPGNPLTLVTLPLASDPPKLFLSADEMILVRDIKNDQVLNDAMNFTHLHAMYVDSMKLFRELRNEIASLTSETRMDSDGQAISVFEGANASVAQIKKQEADHLLASLVSFMDDDFRMVTNLFHDCQKAMLDKLGKDRLRTTWAVERMESITQTAARTATAPPGEAAPRDASGPRRPSRGR